MDLGAGCGLRQGEIFGLAVDEVDFLGGIVHVVRQVKMVRAKLVSAPPKGGKLRDVPLLSYSRERNAVNRDFFSMRLWKPALVAADVIPPHEPGERFTQSREHGMHALRHFDASLLLDAREYVKALSEYLGHGDPGFTLGT